jgi:flagellar basal-body rod modification protein FlgD
MSIAALGSNANTVQPYATQAGSAQSTNSNLNADASSTDSIGSTFLTLLVQELQNQDPTAPMDSTQMVGQMISLNQLDQLSSINQVLTTAFGSTASTSSSDGSNSPSPNISAVSQQALQAAATNAASNSATTPGNSQSIF